MSSDAAPDLDSPLADQGDEEVLFKYSAPVIKAKWHVEQIRNQRKGEIDSSWRRKQLAKTIDCNSSLRQLDGICKETDDVFFGFTSNKDTEDSATKSGIESFRHDRALPPDISIPCLSGWLFKRRKATFLGLSISRGWRRCWFVAVMEAGGLTLARHDKEPYTTPTKLFRLNTELCAVAETTLDGAGRFCFSVSVAGIRERMALGASSQEQAEQWRSTLNSVSRTIRASTSMLEGGEAP